MKINVIFLILWLINSSTSTNIDCLYRLDTWTASGDVYVCDNQNNLNIISSETAIITSSSGTHNNTSTNEQVTAYLAHSRRIEYFPSGLERIYKNLVAFFIQKCGLRRIQQSDIKVYPKLVELNLGYNKIDVLEDDLFNFNLKIKFIFLSGNNISHIGLEVFDGLSSLSYLFLKNSNCINTSANNSTSRVKSVILMTQSKCYDSNYVLYTEKVNKLQDPLICANSTIDNSLKMLKNSNYSQHELTKSKLEFITRHKQNWCINDRIEDIKTTMLMKNLQKDRKEIEKFIQNAVAAYINATVEDRLTKIEKIVENLVNLTAGNLQSGDENGDKIRDLEKSLDQMKIRMVLIGASAVLVTLVIIVGICMVEREE